MVTQLLGPNYTSIPFSAQHGTQQGFGQSTMGYPMMGTYNPFQAQPQVPTYGFPPLGNYVPYQGAYPEILPQGPIGSFLGGAAGRWLGDRFGFGGVGGAAGSWLGSLLPFQAGLQPGMSTLQVSPYGVPQPGYDLSTQGIFDWARNAVNWVTDAARSPVGRAIIDAARGYLSQLSAYPQAGLQPGMSTLQASPYGVPQPGFEVSPYGFSDWMRRAYEAVRDVIPFPATGGSPPFIPPTFPSPTIPRPFPWSG